VRVLRLILAGIIALGVLFMGFLTALLLMITGLVGYVIQLFRPKPSGSGAGAGPGRRPPTGTGDVIDVVATKVPSDPPKLGAER
jgi:hypothetical protein